MVAVSNRALDSMFGVQVPDSYAKAALTRLCEQMPELQPAIGEMLGGVVPVRNRWAQRYDTVFLALDAAGGLTSTNWSAELFAQVTSDTVFGQKGDAERNIITAGQLSSNERFLVYQLGFSVSAYYIPTALYPLPQDAIDDLAAILTLLSRRTAAVLKSGGDTAQVLGPLCNWAGPDVGGVTFGTQYYDSAGPISGSPSLSVRPSPLRDMPWLDEPLEWNAGAPQTVALTSNQSSLIASAPAANAGLADILIACRITAVGHDQKTIQP